MSLDEALPVNRARDLSSATLYGNNYYLYGTLLQPSGLRYWFLSQVLKAETDFLPVRSTGQLTASTCLDSATSDPVPSVPYLGAY